MSWDPYAVLGVSPSASAEEIKRTYRQLARQCHPDRVGSQGEEQFKAITQAYEVLGDPDKRRQWDHLHPRHPQPSMPAPPPARRVVVRTQTSPTAPQDSLNTIRDRLKQHQWMAAMTAAEQLHSQFPGDGQVRHLLALAYFRLGEAHLQRGSEELAHHYLFKAMFTDPEDAGMVFDIKRALSRLGRS